MENILITGVSTGIGYSLCKHYLEQGCRVFGSVRNQKDADRLSDEFGEHFHPLIFDVTDHDAVVASVTEVKKVINDEGLACLINNSGIAITGPVLHLPVSKFQEQLDVNLFGLIAVTKAFLPLLGAIKDYHGKPGKILNMSSISGRIAFPFMGPYCVSKFAIEAFSDSLRRELFIYGVDVISIQPGQVKTPIWKKSSTISEEILQSDYAASLVKFKEFARKGAKKGMEVDDLAQKVYNVYKMTKPKTRYVFMNKKFQGFTIPNYFLSPRKLDRFIKKMFFSPKV